MTLIHEAEKRRAAGKAWKGTRRRWSVRAAVLVALALGLWQWENLPWAGKILARESRALGGKVLAWEKSLVGRFSQQRQRAAGKEMVPPREPPAGTPSTAPLPLAQAEPASAEIVAIAEFVEIGGPVESPAMHLEIVAHPAPPRRGPHAPAPFRQGPAGPPRHRERERHHGDGERHRRGEERWPGEREMHRGDGEWHHGDGKRHRGDGERREESWPMPPPQLPDGPVLAAAEMDWSTEKALPITPVGTPASAFRTALWSWIKGVRPEKTGPQPVAGEGSETAPGHGEKGHSVQRSNGMHLLALTMREQVARLDVRGVQVEAYSSRALINGHIVQQGERIACEGKRGLTFCGVVNGELLFRDDAGNEHRRSLRGSGP
ncbi:MAG: hypothetical protein LBT98_03625 [Puniceicoccales bacterium]|nr:hypothetical protein [Puniceicoccales bacterium]